MTRTETRATKTSPPALDVALAMAGTVCGVLVTKSLDSTDGVKVIGMALGAAIPPFITVVGPWRHIRATAGLLVAVVALVLTYAGGLAVNKVSGVEFVPPVGSSSTSSTTPPTTTTGPTVEAGLGIEVSPQVVTCKPKCDNKVTVKSVGTETLVVGAVEFDGPAKARFKQTGDCVGARLDHGQTCGIEVLFSPTVAAGEQTARLVINQNLPGDASFVALTGGVSAPGLDLQASRSGVKCAYQPAGPAGGRDAVQVSFHLLLSGATPDELPGLVPVTGRSDSGAATSFRTAVAKDPKAFVVASLPVLTADYGRSRTITITVDPDGEIAEADEDDNGFRVTLTVPPLVPKPKTTTTLGCQVS